MEGSHPCQTESCISSNAPILLFYLLSLLFISTAVKRQTLFQQSDILPSKLCGLLWGTSPIAFNVPKAQLAGQITSIFVISSAALCLFLRQTVQNISQSTEANAVHKLISVKLSARQKADVPCMGKDYKVLSLPVIPLSLAGHTRKEPVSVPFRSLKKEKVKLLQALWGRALSSRPSKVKS